MRLFEVENRIVNDLIEIFRQLRGRSDSKRTIATIPWPAVNQLLQNFGYSDLNVASLASLVKQYPALDNEVKTFDETGIVLNTEIEKQQEPTEVPDGPSVDQMAHAGAQDYQQDIAK